jgi:antitoxin ParD1/3/4
MRMHILVSTSKQKLGLSANTRQNDKRTKRRKNAEHWRGCKERRAMPTRNVNLTDELDHFVLQEIESGRYENASEVVRAALRTLDVRNSDTRLSLPRCGPPSTKATLAALPRAMFLSVSVRSSTFLPSTAR